jgi:hypothetical protein
VILRFPFMALPAPSPEKPAQPVATSLARRAAL